jgi:hypothetical protein
MIMDYKKWFDRILWIILIPFTCISFVFTPMTNDSRIFLAAESIADRFYPLPYGWDAAYEVKPIGNRIWNWFFYKFANFFVPFVSNHYTEFGWFVKALALVVVVVCCWYISKKIVFPYAFPILFLGFAGEANFGLMMPEWWGALFTLVVVAMIIDAKPSEKPLLAYFEKWAYRKDYLKEYSLPFLAGVFFIFIGLLKGITIFFIIPAVCIVYLLGYKVQWGPAIAGFLTGGLAFLACCFTIWPYALSDIFLSRLIAHIGEYNAVTLLDWFWWTQGRSNLISVMYVYIPIVFIGMFVGIYLTLKYWSTGQYKTLALFLIMWLSSISMIIIQSEFIVYHYTVLIPASIISILLLLKIIKVKWATVVVVVAIMFSSYLLINSVFGSYTTFEYTFWHQKELSADVINAPYDLPNQTSILYLDPGDASYYFHANSSCRYITPMPVERSTPEWNITYLPAFTEDYNCIMAYQGQYIVADILRDQELGYFGEGITDRAPIMEMIAKNYTLVSNVSWDVYERKDMINNSINTTVI